jgi:death on curing protein
MSFLSSRDVYDYKYRGWRFPTLGFALRLNERVLGHNRGLRDEGLLISALNAPVESSTEGDYYYRLFDKVSELGYRVAKSHPFHDGNKRTALGLVDTILEWNGFYLQWSDDSRVLIFSLVGAGYLRQEGLRHALLLGCKQDPAENVP